jgi:hypothetical protein
LNFAFNKSLTALLKILAAILGSLSKGHHVVPLGMVIPLTALIFAALSGSDRERADWVLSGGVTKLGIFSEVSEQEYFIYSHTTVLSNGAL